MACQLLLGVEIKVIKEGSGPAPRPGQKVSVHYILTLEDGKKVDSSYDRGREFEFTVGKGEVISGWDEGIQKVNLGSKVKATISPVRSIGFQITINHSFQNKIRFIVPLICPNHHSFHRIKLTARAHQVILFQRTQPLSLKLSY